MLHFANPWFLLLLVLVPILIWRYLRRLREGEGPLRLASTISLEGVPTSWTVRIRHALFGLKMLALVLAIIAFSRPQRGTDDEEILTEGVDIILTLDASGSMAAEDFAPRNRLYVAKNVVRQFIEGRKSDRIGLVVFAGKALSRCPLTLDYNVLLAVLDAVELGAQQDGTAIGSAIATSVNRLRGSKAKSKVIILVTDGVNNRGEIQPLDAASIAETLGIKIYTVGVGSRGIARFPVIDPRFGKIYTNLPVEIDEESLTRIAEMTGGIYYRATDRGSLENIFAEIGRLETTKIEVKRYRRYNELFLPLLLPALGLVLVEIVAGNTRFQKLP